ncbi:hypothetical protein OKW21_000318 [Catalinimonas alkaloidigena]|uniref:hypothetical protein n=1 Tax=Catalinimonas alkaloidigena TaxID=1075417 RepID=UPI002405921B|nr:hypothetical protein [Catalinimonas alkaloidigena]MDF9795055.1 hypothetical protein [Catalinimonas alkaloidigena]
MSTMQRYFEQLVDDIRESAKNKDQNVQFNIPTDLLEVPEEYEHLEVEPAQKASEWFRLSPEMFPPAEKWTERQLLYMCAILRQLYEHYNIIVELPSYLPYDLVYTYLLKAMDVYITCDQESLNDIRFCDGKGYECPFGKHCTNEGEYHCDTWEFGQDWEGFSDLKYMEDNDEE